MMTPILRPREIKFLRELREKSLNPSKMETNELPEEVKREIRQYCIDHSVSPSDEYFIERNVEFGYRLALPIKGGGIKGKGCDDRGVEERVVS